MNKLGENLNSTHETIDGYKDGNSPNISTVDWTKEQEILSSRKHDMTEIQENIRIVIEENEALRKGMHEIMDSIRNQDGEFLWCNAQFFLTFHTQFNNTNQLISLLLIHAVLFLNYERNFMLKSTENLC